MQKQRVSRACDTCKRRKIRCTGKQPCAHCIKNDKTCEFKALYTRGAVPVVQSAPLEEQEKFLEEVGYKRRQIWRKSPSRKVVSLDEEVGNIEDDEESENEEAGEGDGDLNQVLPEEEATTLNPFNYEEVTPKSNSYGQDNHQTSEGTSLFERTQHSMNRHAYHHKNPISAYGDPPLPDFDASFIVLPSEAVAQTSISKYFDFVSATNRFLHRPTVEKWTTELLSSPRRMRTGAEENSHRAVILMLFASTHQYMDDQSEDRDANTSFYYFQAASLQLSKEVGEIRLPTIQARLLQCLFLLSRSRINQCYTIFGTIVTLIYTLGVKKQRQHKLTSDLLELEMQRRVFWSAYVMDKYLSSALGRPQMLRDEDIDQELPTCVEDEGLSTSYMRVAGEGEMCAMRGAVYQIKLSQIISQISRTLYTTKPLILPNRLFNTEELASELSSWRKEIAHFLDLEPSMLSPLYMRQNTALRLSYAQARILLYRPFLLDKLSTDENGGCMKDGTMERMREMVDECIKAALEVTKVIDGMYKLVGGGFGASWFAHFVAYSAIISLYLSIIQTISSLPAPAPTSSSALISPSPTDPANTTNTTKILQTFNTATKCQSQLKSTFSPSPAKESFAQKCTTVLEEARTEALLKIRLGQARGVLSSSADIEGLDSLGGLGMGEGSRDEERRGGWGTRTERRGMRGLNSYFGENWRAYGDGNEMGFDRSAPGGGVLYSLFNHNDENGGRGLSGGGRDGNGNGLVDRIDRWGFSSLTGY